MAKHSKKLAGLLDFIDFTHEFRSVIRVARTPNSPNFENDTEHSYQLAMVAWFLIEKEKLDLSREKCLLYALAHDLVEVYAGDTFAFDKNIKNHESKKEREHKALLKIKKRFPKFKSLIKVIGQYEKREDEESKFVYAIDKILPPIQIYTEKGKLWHEKDIGYLDAINQEAKIKISPLIYKYWQELAKILEKDKKKLFPR